jgi:hypothetical protein
MLAAALALSLHLTAIPAAETRRAGLVAPPSEVLGTLLGPLAAIGGPDATGAMAIFDQGLLARSREFAAGFPADPTVDFSGDGRLDVGDSLYYDLPLVFYRIHYRTGDVVWRDHARRVATTWRDHPGNRKIAGFLAKDWSLWPELVNQPRCMGTIGLAVLALEAEDAEARAIVVNHARVLEATYLYGNYQSLTDPIMPLGDPRECGYGLMALVAATLLGEDRRKPAKELLDHIIERQRPDGQWLCKDPAYPDGGYSSNFMTGILIEALALYDRAIGDPRILPAVERNLAWTWSTQWVAAEQGFRYHSLGTAAETRTDGILGALMVQGWGYAYAKTGKPEYLAQGDEIIRGITGRGFKEIWNVKQYAQVFRASSMYFGYVLSR